MRVLFVYFIITFLSFACHNKESLKYNLDQDNELNIFKERYKIKSLKYQAADYMINNLNSYYFDGKNISKYEEIFGFLDSLFIVYGINPEVKNNPKIINPLKKRWSDIITNVGYVSKGQLTYIADKDIITADYLINNLDLAFKAWENNPWSKNVSFENFCEYILPYKVLDEKLDYWRSDLMAKYDWLADSLSDKTDLKEAAIKINRSLVWFHFNDIFYQYPVNQTYSNLIKGKRGSCPHMVTMATYAMRAIGIPVAVDFVPQYGNSNANHTWNVLIDGEKIYPFNGCGHEWLPFGYVFSDEIRLAKLPKVFRRTYSIQDESLFSKVNNTEKIPQQFRDQNIIDVSDQYFRAHDVKIDIHKEYVNNSDQYAYICVFNNQKWFPVHWGEILDGKSYFNKMGGDIMYIVMKYENKKFLPISDPFILTKYGEIKYIRHQLARAQNIVLTRKYPEYLTADSDTTNAILYGDNYELFYWNKRKWSSLGEKKANDSFIIYENVPVDALFWLRNNSRGRQERIFLYDDKQIWW